MVRVFVVYDTQYGNTKLVAEKIAEGMRELNGIETEVSDVKKVDLKKIDSFDAILIGAPIHFGKSSRTIMKFIDKLGGLKLKTKGVAVFDTFLGEDFEKGVKQMEKRLEEKVPLLKLMTSGLSIRVDEIKGPITEGELPKALDFGKKIADQLKPELS